MNEYSPMLCHIGSKDFIERKGFVFEIKLDGTRLILYKDKDKIELRNRKGTQKLWQYPELEHLAGSIAAKRCVIDGELVVYNSSGLPDFNLFLKREQSSNHAQIENYSEKYPAVYVAFDVLELEGKSLLNLPLTERRKILEGTIKESESIELMFCTNNGKKLWDEVIKKNLEGVIAKKENSIYKPGERTRDWLKIKNIKTVDVVIIGFTSDKRQLSSLAMGVYKDKKLIYIGRVGTGFTERFLDELYEKLKKLEIDETPVLNDPLISKIKWLRPELVAEVEYLYLTEDKQLRAPSFKRLRTDKKAIQCTFDDQLENPKKEK